MSMPVYDLECPNCGATVEFGGGTRATCAYCHSALSLSGNTVENAGAPRRETPLPLAPARLPVQTAHSLNARGWLRVGCVFVIASQFLFVCACGAFVALANNLLLRAWGPLDQVAAIVQVQPEVVRALGQPIRLGSPTSSNFQSKNGRTTVKFDAPVIGTAANGKVHVEGRWLDDGWDLEVWITYPTVAGEQRVLIQRRGVY